MTFRIIVTPLQQAVISESLPKMKSLLENGTSPDTHEIQIIKEISNGEIIRVGECFSADTITDAPNNRRLVYNTNLKKVVIRDDSGVLGGLFNGMTPIFLAVMLDFKPGFELLIEKGADVNKRDMYGNSPLHYAARSGKFVKELLDSGADYDMMNLHYMTPIYYAISGKRGQVLRLLLEKGARIDIGVEFNYTPLHLAVEVGFDHGVEILLESGIDVNVPNRFQHTPLFTAALARNPHMFRLLREKGAALNSRDLSSQNVEEFHEKIFCWSEELERLKIVKFGCWSFYDVFSLPDCRDPLMVTNVEMASRIYSLSFETEFPVYAPFLKKYFSQAQARSIMINEAQGYLFQFLLPKEIQRMILLFLSNEDLINYLRAND